ncbi:hypothetical protein EOD41_00515 [Mucilaginibacter limnophilus]|uniref:Lipoprotein n=1 Tax=Mucilaginibacter limnophilus TaxID=1932778 RepID=A0A437MXX4_9SPHI|nr:hypothetical protein [Mucilaginibacter limnophilus]RVU02456.1 hypothetical protein EOD41_00515 [Mucilaginibacter limnophilus]
MRNFIKNYDRSLQTNTGANGHLRIFKKGMLPALLFLTIIFVGGCKKTKLPVEKEESYYGYGKLTVECEKKCHVSFGVPGKMNEYDVESNKAIYFFRYQTKYNIDIYVTPLDAKQTMEINVFSREEKQIFNNSVRRDVNDTWYSKILVP